MKVNSEFRVVSSRDSAENIIVGLYAFFLNTGVLDKHLVALDGKVKFPTFNIADMGIAILNHNDGEMKKFIYTQFLLWVNNNPLATFLLEEPYVMGDFKHSFDKGNAYPKPFDWMTAQRFKDLTGFDRRRMPKDLKKSFEKKAQTSLTKFMVELKQKPGFLHGSIEELMNQTLNVKYEGYIRYESLRSIHNNLLKYTKQGEDMTESIQRVRDMWEVVHVMES
jgi:hypothetical protein